MSKLKSKPVEAKPDFPELERKILEYWDKEGIVDAYLKRNRKSAKQFSFLDGPITANNPMGVHHGWGRTYKDLWQRFYNMLGYRQRFQNGFDSQGLWVEVEVEKELGFISKKDIETYGISKFVEKCKQRVNKYSSIQTEQSKRLGYFMDWNHSYYTMSDDNNYMIWHFLKVCHRNGWLYKGKDSVPWCPRCETAISQHEMLTEDYKEVVHKAIYIAFPIEDRIDEYLIIWTTTPWTLPANIAVAVDEKLSYALVEVEKKRKYWVVRERIEPVFSKTKYRILKEKKGRDILGVHYRTPFDALPAVNRVAKKNPEKIHKVIATDSRILPISVTEGTGLVHTAVSAGSEDYKLGKILKLPMIPVINDQADYFSGFGELSGKNAKKQPELIFNFLKRVENKTKEKWIITIENYLHRYPACWRCKEELVWKVTDEWYLAMDKGKPSLRTRMKRVAKKIHWIPDFGLDRELDWLKNMQDWLISKKNRYWGLCLPIWECSECGTFEVIGSKKELKEKAIEGWQEFEGKSPHKPQIDRIKIRCQKCDKPVSRIEPVGNPWLDAGIVPFSTISRDNQSRPLYFSDRKTWETWFPADFITESFPGQFKNWFYSLIAMSTVLENREPFRTVLGFATLLAEDGRPMHKSWGNMIEFNKGAENIGVDVMRWMYARQDPKQNLLFGMKTADLVRRQFHLTLWNSYRFVVNNLLVDRPALEKQSISRTLLDEWILSRTNSTIIKVTSALKHYDAAPAVRYLEDLVQDFSTWYIRRSRDRVGSGATVEMHKLGFYLTSKEVIITVSKLLAPITPFLAEIIYRNLTSQKSVHLSEWPQVNRELINTQLELQMQVIRLASEKFHSQRKSDGIQLRQPLGRATFSTPIELNQELTDLLKDEINVEVLDWKKRKGEVTTQLDTTLTRELKEKGYARQLIRKIQNERKKIGTKIEDQILVTTPKIPKGFADEIKRKTKALKLKQGKHFKVEITKS